MMHIAALDYLVLVAYLALILFVGVRVRKNKSLESFFLNNRKTQLLVLWSASLSTTVGAGVVIGTASASYQSGLSFGLLLLLITLIGWWLMARLAPRIKQFGDTHKAYTVGDYLAYSYSDRVRTVSRLVVVSAYFIIVALQFIALAQLLSLMTALSFELALVGVALLTVGYTMVAGVRGVFYTDVVQCFIMLIVFVLLLGFGFSEISPRETFTLPEGYLSPYNYSGPLFFWAGLIFAIPLIVATPDAWHRTFAASDVRTAQKALYYTGIVKALIIAAAIIIGMLAFHLVPNVPGDQAMFALMAELLPVGLLGLGLASIMAIIMSTLDMAILVGSTTIVKDFYMVRQPKTTQAQAIKMGRWAAALFGVGGLLLAYFVQDIVILTIVSAQVMLVFAPALLGSLVWRQHSVAAAYYSIAGGFIITLLAVPLDANLAFIPGLLVATSSYIGLSWWHKRKKM